MTAVTTPTGSSPGIRATQVGHHQEAAPKIAESGRTSRAFGPTTRRTMWGTTSPTKPMSPAMATAAAVTSDAAPSRIARSRRTFSPEVRGGLLAEEEAVERARPAQQDHRPRSP